MRLNSQWKERPGGYQDEITTEEIACLRNGQPFLIRVRWEQTFFGNASTSYRIESETPITQEDYQKICQENGGILDTPDVREGIAQRSELLRMLQDLIPTCPKCGTHMAERSGKRGKFWGCSRFPKCEGTKPWDEDLATQRSALYKELVRYENL